MSQQERSELIRHCKWVDEVICPCPWIISIEFLDFHRIDYVCHDALPYNFGASTSSNDIYTIVKNAGIFLETSRTEGVSTSDVIARIIKDYDELVKRNVKRGYKRQELGISYFKEKKIQIQLALQSIQES